MASPRWKNSPRPFKTSFRNSTLQRRCVLISFDSRVYLPPLTPRPFLISLCLSLPLPPSLSPLSLFVFFSHVPPTQVAAIVKRLDKDQDGNVSLEELRAEIDKAEIKEEILEEKLD